MTCSCAPSLLLLRKQVDGLYPGRDRASDGCCGDAVHAARKSDHNPAVSGPGRGYAHAEDIDEDIARNMGDAPLTDMALRLLADPRTKYLIYEAQLLYPNGIVRPYHGINAHRHHLHVSIHDWATFDLRLWPVGSVPLPPKEMPVTEAQGNEILGRLKNIEGLLATGDDNNGQPRGPIGAVVAKIDQRTGEIKTKVGA